MAETTDDLSTPLGQETVSAKKRRLRLPFTGLQALAVALGLFLVVFAGVALFNDNPLGGEPTARIVLRQPGGRRRKIDRYRPRQRPRQNPPDRRLPSDQKTITIIDGSSGKRQDVVISGDGADKTDTDASPVPMAGVDQRLLEKSRYGMIPVVADGLKPSRSMPPKPTAPKPPRRRWSRSWSAVSASAPPRPRMPS